jgi:Winged helix-turn-helix domain (DUF2582)
MEEEIGTVAGAVWNALKGSAGLTLPKLKRRLNHKGHLVDWAIGWLARENKIAITRGKKTLHLHLKDSGS